VAARGETVLALERGIITLPPPRGDLTRAALLHQAVPVMRLEERISV
jgi:hypothetical protein